MIKRSDKSVLKVTFKILHNTHHIRTSLIYLFPDRRPFRYLVLLTPSLVPRPVRAIRVTRGNQRHQRGLGTLTGDVTSEITEDDWERG